MSQSSSKAYLHRRIGGRAGKMRLAHHVIWEERYGPIPEGHQIHHIDENPKNNDIENLQCLTVSDHQRIHSPYYFKVNGEWVQFCKRCKEINLNLKYRVCKPCRAREARIERRKNT